MNNDSIRVYLDSAVLFDLGHELRLGGNEAARVCIDLSADDVVIVVSIAHLLDVSRADGATSKLNFQRAIAAFREVVFAQFTPRSFEWDNLEAAIAAWNQSRQEPQPPGSAPMLFAPMPADFISTADGWIGERVRWFAEQSAVAANTVRGAWSPKARDVRRSARAMIEAIVAGRSVTEWLQAISPDAVVTGEAAAGITTAFETMSGQVRARVAEGHDPYSLLPQSFRVAGGEREWERIAAIVAPGMFLANAISKARERDSGREARPADFGDAEHVVFCPYMHVFTLDNESWSVVGAEQFHRTANARILRNPTSRRWGPIVDAVAAVRADLKAS